jgi:hypothetical protein
LYRYFVSFAAITLCVASQRVFIVVSVYFVMTQSGKFEYTLVIVFAEVWYIGVIQTVRGGVGSRNT